MFAGNMIFEKLLVMVAIGTFAGEAKRSLIEESFEIIVFSFNFIASAFLGFSLGYIFYYLRGKEELVPFLGGLIGYFGSDFAEGKALVFLQNRLEGGG
ncbi:hypothetical protein I0Q91_00285 [Halanaerobiaceae bacterium Z-7014]|uniref:Uncharacterized protein n=1 Tax=Halonatronomonas betaini TaxID=2778430 RepID=A0A931APL5_9FIRM|nr:hypothetical protein [Halonatronomonas betaini]MBF8435501.1 hypothetical protein [Halonatronomonas betaini]